jgi:nitric oxide reductase NorE protein
MPPLPICDGPEYIRRKHGSPCAPPWQVLRRKIKSTGDLVTAITRDGGSVSTSRHLPGEAGIWLFIFGDMMVFSLFFLTFMYYRGHELELFRESSHKLSQFFGALNTFFMLSSSWFVAMAVQASRRQMRGATTALFLMGFLCGVGFLVNKVFEYGDKISHGITLNTNDFFMYYYMLTGIHMMHVTIGMGVLLFAAKYAWGGNLDARKVRNLESSASVWHVVDLLWIVLFALLYLIR